MSKLSMVTDWYGSLDARERMLVSITGIIVIATLFYLLLWEPIYKGLDEERLKRENQQSNLVWMQQAAAEARSLKASGARSTVRNSNSPVSLSIEQSIGTAGLKNNLSKLESSGKDSARAVLDNVSFNQMVVWLNTLESVYGISANSATIDRTDKEGYVNARLNMKRRQ